MQHEKTKELAMTALMTALIFTATYIIKIPNPAEAIMAVTAGRNP